MKRVLFTAKVDSHIINFHIPYLKWFKEHGYEVHVASNGESSIPYADVKYNLDFDRNPLKPSNFKVYLRLKNLIDSNEYDIIHCHTPIGGALARLAARDARKKGTTVIYTAHGFHFLKGGSKASWIIFYPVEKFLSRCTDCLITINEEDYNLAKSKKFRAKDIRLVNGVGVDLERFAPALDEEKKNLREKLGYSTDDFIVIYIAELNANKHQDLAINAINIIKNKIPNIKLLLAGDGVLKDEYKNQINTLNLNKNIEMLGHRKDVDDLLRLSNMAISTSRREGLPRNIMEAMATGLPLVVTKCRGNSDLVKDNINGYEVNVDDPKELAEKIYTIYKDNELRMKFGNKSIEMVDDYSLKKVLKSMEDIYLNYISK